MVSQHWWFRWFRNIDGFDGFATLMVSFNLRTVSSKNTRTVLLGIQELWSIEMTSLYNKNEKWVLPHELRFDWTIWGRNDLFTKNLICSYGPSAHFGCSGFPYRAKNNYVFTLLEGFVGPCYVNIRVSGPKKPFRSITKHGMSSRTTFPPLFSHLY